MGLVGMTLAGTFIWDRFCVYLFASEIFKARASPNPSGPSGLAGGGGPCGHVGGHGGLCQEDNF